MATYLFINAEWIEFNWCRFSNVEMPQYVPCDKQSWIQKCVTNFEVTNHRSLLVSEKNSYHIFVSTTLCHTVKSLNIKIKTKNSAYSLVWVVHKWYIKRLEHATRLQILFSDNIHQLRRTTNCNDDVTTNAFQQKLHNDLVATLKKQHPQQLIALYELENVKHVRLTLSIQSKEPIVTENTDCSFTEKPVQFSK